MSPRRAHHALLQPISPPGVDGAATESAGKDNSKEFAVGFEPSPFPMILSESALAHPKDMGFSPTASPSPPPLLTPAGAFEHLASGACQTRSLLPIAIQQTIARIKRDQDQRCDTSDINSEELMPSQVQYKAVLDRNANLEARCTQLQTKYELLQSLCEKLNGDVRRVSDTVEGCMQMMLQLMNYFSEATRLAGHAEVPLQNLRQSLGDLYEALQDDAQKDQSSESALEDSKAP
ncbi:hypothetical protein K461DRAFT_323542 [Myriangium duriaei CBS 260.36]|uniref:Uncharacterized protein n=1 Tax=Myriangium duriaei CBS 260.36 TaxID=1168546 RepID=A0A9P4IX31_9PEZI|nr:hypothetical protein K461DRAFT_323542 [Myriangium duriaei CBS 260.36]